MMLQDYLYSNLLVFALISRAQAHRACTECIPLERLLTEAYGIELTANGLHSAIAFHNGTMEYIAYTPGSAEYQSLMQSILNRELDRSPQRRTSCLQVGTRPVPSAFDESFLSFLIALFSLPKKMWDKYIRQPVHQEPPVPVSPTVQLFQSQMEAITPFAHMSAEQRSHISVSISVPAWLTGTEEDCQVLKAAVMAFGRVGKSECPPSASYTALGYELCSIDYDAFECKGPGRIMTIEFEDNLTVMSLTQTPFMSSGSLTFSASREQDDKALVEWINLFVDTENPDMVVMTGSNADVPRMRNAVLHSHAAAYLIEPPSVPVHRAVAMGAAQALKGRLESHSDDCSEFEECVEIRRQADRIAGKYKVARPSIWPAIGRLHLHDEL